jgi:hypothetical protein
VWHRPRRGYGDVLIATAKLNGVDPQATSATAPREWKKPTRAASLFQRMRLPRGVHRTITLN